MLSLRHIQLKEPSQGCRGTCLGQRIQYACWTFPENQLVLPFRESLDIFLHKGRGMHRFPALGNGYYYGFTHPNANRQRLKQHLFTPR